VPADHGLGVDACEHLGPPREAAVNQHDLLVVARSGVAEEDFPEAGDGERRCRRQAVEQVDLGLAELAGSPRSDRVRDLGVATARQLDQVTVGVAPYPHRAVTQRGQPLQCLRG
jgi:hypothetical protein